VNTIKKTFRVVSSGAEFHILLVQNAVFTNFKLQVNAPSNDPFFAEACKDFSPPCPTLICQTYVQISSEEIEVST